MPTRCLEQLYMRRAHQAGREEMRVRESKPRAYFYLIFNKFSLSLLCIVLQSYSWKQAFRRQIPASAVHIEKKVVLASGISLLQGLQDPLPASRVAILHSSHAVTHQSTSYNVPHPKIQSVLSSSVY